MSNWSSDELNKIGTAEELEIMPSGTWHNAVTIWVVRVDDALYVRSYNGSTGSWFRAAQRTREGRIRAGGIEREVSFVNADTNLYEQVNAAYRSKYGRYPQYVNPMLTDDVQSTTLKLIPKS
mgnify:CR=1 FL=1